MAKIGNVNLILVGDQPVFTLKPGTLVKYQEQFCIRNWAGMGTLDGQLWWNNETIERLKMCAEVLPFGATVEVIQK
jgi:hypothetical protein